MDTQFILLENVLFVAFKGGEVMVRKRDLVGL